MSTKTDKRHAIYPGTFDPITYGHVDLINRSLSVFDEVIVLIAHSGRKNPLFTADERRKLIELSFPKDSRIKVDLYDGLLAEYARTRHVDVVIRGLRGVSDFEYEFQMASMNTRLNPELQTFFLMASEKYFFVNSTLVKEVISHGGSVHEFVPPHVESLLKERLC